VATLASISSLERPLGPRLSSLKAGRDSAVDVIKGTACLLMVFAHVPFDQAPWLGKATMATVLFFTSTGINLAGILERRAGEAKRLAANGFFLIFAGFADNYVQGTLGDCDVFQIAGLAMLAMLLMRWVLPLHWTWLFPVPFLLHLANQHLYWKIAAGGVSSFLLAPGLFPLIPWLCFYLLGAHLRKYNERHAWRMGAAATGALAFFHLWQPFSFDKFWVSPDYFLIGCAVICFSYAALRRWLTKPAEVRLTEIRRWGANSLVFYILNNFIIIVLEMFQLRGIALLLLSIALTMILLRPALSLQKWTSTISPAFVLVAGVLISSAVLAVNAWLWPNSYYLHTLSSFGLTFSFIACYPAWKNLSRVVWNPAAQASRAGLAQASPESSRSWSVEQSTADPAFGSAAFHLERYVGRGDQEYDTLGGARQAGRCRLAIDRGMLPHDERGSDG